MKLELIFVLILFSGHHTEGLGGQDDDGSLIHIVYDILHPASSPTSRKSRIVSPTLFGQGPPPFQEYARMARYVVHNSNWCSMATVSTRDPIQGYPFANVFSVSDGSTIADATGIPYFYLTPLEMSAKDLNVNNNASITMSLAQGQIVKVEKDSSEEKFARKSLFRRHPDMPGWPEDHGWYFAKMDIKNIIVLDYFGGANTVSVDDYLKATPY